MSTADKYPGPWRVSRDDLLSLLDSLKACSSSTTWLRLALGTPERLWDSCPRGDWMLWLAARVGVDRKSVVAAACDCAEPALAHVPAGDTHPKIAIETTRRWCAGEATLDEVRRAADAAACAAKVVAAGACAACAACAAADAACAACAAETAAKVVAAACTAACADYGANDVYAAYDASLSCSADLVRARIPWAVVEAALAKARGEG